MKIRSLLAAMSIFGIVSSNIALAEQAENMKISVKAADKTIIFQLNNSTASKALYEQLPLEIKVEDYSSNEKIFYPPKKLSTDNTPLAKSAAGDLAYYAPWGDVVMFYEDFGKASGLYALGQATAGAEYIRGLSGSVLIEKVD